MGQFLVVLFLVIQDTVPKSGSKVSSMHRREERTAVPGGGVPSTALSTAPSGSAPVLPVRAM